MRRARQDAILAGGHAWPAGGRHRGLSCSTSGQRERGIKGLGRVFINANSVLLGHRARPPHMNAHTHTHSQAHRADCFPELWSSPTLREGKRKSLFPSLLLHSLCLFLSHTHMHTHTRMPLGH